MRSGMQCVKTMPGNRSSCVLSLRRPEYLVRCEVTEHTVVHKIGPCMYYMNSGCLPAGAWSSSQPEVLQTKTGFSQSELSINCYRCEDLLRRIDSVCFKIFYFSINTCKNNMFRSLTLIPFLLISPKCLLTFPS